MTHPLTNNLMGRKRARDSRGNTCVSPWEYAHFGFAADTGRFATIDGEVTKVTIVNGSLVWEPRKW